MLLKQTAPHLAGLAHRASSGQTACKPAAVGALEGAVSIVAQGPGPWNPYPEGTSSVSRQEKSMWELSVAHKLLPRSSKCHLLLHFFFPKQVTWPEKVECLQVTLNDNNESESALIYVTSKLFMHFCAFSTGLNE